MLVSGFPPADHVIVRTLEFAKHLPEFGWTPLVLTSRSSPGARARSFDPPATVPVVRTLRAPTPSEVARWLGFGSRRPADGGAVSPADPSVTRRNVASLARQALLWCDMPDDFAGWVPFALFHGWRLCRTQGIAAIHASGPPFSVVLAGALLARLTRLPLVSDLRDAWTQDLSDPLGTIGGRFRARVSARRLRWLRAIENSCLRQSAAILFTSPATLVAYQGAHPEAARRMHLVYNGADPEDFTASVPVLDRPTAVHVGTLHDFQWPQVLAFLEALSSLRSAGRLGADCRVVFAGTIGDSLRRRLDAAVAQLGLSPTVTILGFVAHAEAIAWMRKSWALLLFAGDNPFFRLSKLSEYLAAGRPILALAGEESPTAGEVARHGGTVVDGRDPGPIEGALARLLGSQGPVRWEPPSIAHPHPLNRKTEAELLGRVLDDVARGVVP